MCGIFGYVSTKENDAFEVIHKGLKRLEYRGYDSWGISVLQNGTIKTCKTTTMPIIYIDDDPIQKIIYEGNCLTIQGEKDDLLKAVQRVLFDWYKIIPDES